MSDADTVRFYLDKRDDLAGWLALARLESQNQALQERATDLEAHFRTVLFRHYSGKIDDGCELNARALSPTQETDPE